MSLTVAFLAPHTGRHAAAAVFPLAALASRFLGSLRRARERPDGAITAKGGSVTVRPVNGRNLGTQPRQHLAASTLDRRKPLANRQPWQTAQNPLLRDPEPGHAWDPGDGLGPLVQLARPYVPEAAE